MNIYESQVRKFYTELWDKQNFSEISEILWEDFSFRGSLGQEKQGHAGFIEYVNWVHGSLSQYHCIIEELVVEPGKVFAKMLFKGWHTGELMGFPATQQEVAWSGAALFTFRGEKLSDLWVLGDIKSLEQQLSSQPKL